MNALFPCRTLFLSTIFALSAAGDDRVADKVRQFSFKPPNDFVEFPEGRTKPSILHCFVKKGPSEDSPKIVFQVEVMNGTFPPSQRLKESEIPKLEGMTFALGEIVWKKITLDRIRQTLPSPDGAVMVSFWCQLPTIPRAIQLLVIGPLEKEKEISSALARVVDSFEGKVNSAK